MSNKFAPKFPARALKKARDRVKKREEREALARVRELLRGVSLDLAS